MEHTGNQAAAAKGEPGETVMKAKLAILVVVAAVALVGCDPAKKYYGTWEGQKDKTKVTWTFGPGNKIVTETSMSNQRLGDFTLKTEGTFKVTNNELWITNDSITSTGLPDRMKSRIEEAFGGKKDQATYAPFVFQNDDEAVMRVGGDDFTLKRKKS